MDIKIKRLLIVFVSSPYVTPQLQVETVEAKEERVSLLIPKRSVSPEKKEKVKTISKMVSMLVNCAFLMIEA